MNADGPAEHRTLILTVRLTAAERQHIVEAAKAAETTPSGFVRDAALGNPVTLRTYVSLSPEDLSQLKRLGHLLNQIARAGWRGRFTPAADEHLNATLTELRIAFRKLSRTRLTP